MLEFRERLHCAGKSRPSYAFCGKALGDLTRGTSFMFPVSWQFCSHAVIFWS